MNASQEVTVNEEGKRVAYIKPNEGDQIYRVAKNPSSTNVGDNDPQNISTMV